MKVDICWEDVQAYTTGITLLPFLLFTDFSALLEQKLPFCDREATEECVRMEDRKTGSFLRQS